MLSFAETKNRHRAMSSKHNQVPRPHLAYGHESDSNHKLRYPTPNQAVQWGLQNVAKEGKAALPVTTSPYSGFGFSRIQIQPSTSGTLQAKLALNKPGDLFEQEADRIADQVAGMPESRMESKGLQTKRIQGNETEQVAAPPIIGEVIATPGRPLDTATRAFMEPRLGHSFANVRIHTDGRAAASAQAIGARAYTVGNHIVMGEKASTQSSSGQRLLAHELVHTIQQGGRPWFSGTCLVQWARP